MTDQSVKAVPNIYIDVILNGQKQVYDIEMARELHRELGIALQSLEAVETTAQVDSDTESQISP